MNKPWWKSKTIWFSTALAITGAVQQFLPQLKDIITPDLYGWILFYTGIVSGALRAVTTQGVGK